MSAMPLPATLADVLARGDIWRGDTLPGLPENVIPSGHAELDAELPGGGWPRGNLTEILIDRNGLGEMGLLLPALASLSAAGGWLALLEPPALPHAPSWLAAGVALERLVIIRAGKEMPWCCEQLLACGGFAGVLAWPKAAIEPRLLRRLQVAVEERPTFACLWRPLAVAAIPSPAPLRLRVESGEAGLSVDVFKRRGRPATRSLHLAIARPGRSSRALAGPSLSPAAARSAALAAVA